MITGEYDQMRRIAEYNLCADHKTPLVVAWHPQGEVWVLRCADDHYPEAVVRNMSLTERRRAGEVFPEPIQSNIEKGERRRAMTQNRTPTALTMGGVPATDLGTSVLLLPEQIKALVAFAEYCSLDASLGHVIIYQGKPYITIDGYLYHAHQVKTDYQLKSRPLSEEERLVYLIPEKAHAWTADVSFSGGTSSFIGTGIVTDEERTEKSKRNPDQLRSPVVAKHPWQLAQKRAEWQALRRAFPIGLTSEEKEEIPDDRP